MNDHEMLAIAIMISMALHVAMCILVLRVIRVHNKLCENIGDMVSAEASMWKVVLASSKDSIEARGVANGAKEQAHIAWAELRNLYVSGAVIEVPRRDMH